MLSLFDEVETQQQPAPRIGEYDARRAAQRAQEGIERAELGAMAHIGDDWPLRAYQAVKIAAERNELFIIDAVWEHVEEPAEPRAIGGIMRRAMAAGLIEDTGRVEKSARVTAHRNKRTVWKSLVYKGGG